MELHHKPNGTCNGELRLLPIEGVGNLIVCPCEFKKEMKQREKDNHDPLEKQQRILRWSSLEKYKG